MKHNIKNAEKKKMHMYIHMYNKNWHMHLEKDNEKIEVFLKRYKTNEEYIKTNERKT